MCIKVLFKIHHTVVITYCQGHIHNPPGELTTRKLNNNYKLILSQLMLGSNVLKNNHTFTMKNIFITFLHNMKVLGGFCQVTESSKVLFSLKKKFNELRLTAANI